jgi:KUP system potassium uptake protein
LRFVRCGSSFPAPLEQDDQARKSTRAALTLAALGIVFGDIGTSPLYAVKETFSPEHGMALTAANILGGLSTIFWSLMIVVSLKYVVLIMRADNRGEGGIMALIALASSAAKDSPRWRLPLLLIGCFGASLFYGDAVLTPAISVLSAVEGLEVGTMAFKPYVVPIAVAVLLALFALQASGTAAIGRLFGPVTMLWFLAIGAAGLNGIAQQPQILQALNPVHALAFVTGHGMVSFVVLGAVVLAVTGAEALYADMGHFGKAPVRIAWFGLVAPALVLNYFGQGAHLIANPSAAQNPFYLLLPGWALYPMVALATAATVIASQAVISGAYSLTKQAVQLGFLPRMNIVQTSAQAYGQVYIPAINWLLCASVVAAVVGFGSSSRLAGAYGVAVTGTMMVDTLLTFFVIRLGWRYPLWLCISATGFFLVIDVAFFASTLTKIGDGGWFPLAIGAFVFVVMTTWRRGREVMFERLSESSVPLGPFLKSLFAEPPPRVPGTAIFLTATPEATPHALLHNLNHNKVLHERVVFLTVETHDVPWVPFEDRVSCDPLGNGCWQVRVRYGFMNRPDVVRALDLCGALGLEFDMMQTSFFLSRQQVIPSAGGPSSMAHWRERMFAAMARNAANVTDYFNIPTNRVIELGTRVEI